MNQQQQEYIQSPSNEMVLRKDRSPSRMPSTSSSSSIEQPVPKKQKIEDQEYKPPDVISVVSQQQQQLHHDSSDEVDKAILLLPPSSCTSSSTSSSSICTSTTSFLVATAGTVPDLVRFTSSPPNNEMADFEDSLLKQCLCSVNEEILRKPFRNHYSECANGTRKIVDLKDWPSDKLIQFLSNIQLLFDVYLKQNAKGFICCRIMDVCDALIQNDHNLIDKIIDLSNSSNKYVQFVSTRVLASFLVITKNHHNSDDHWLKKLIDNLFSFERLDSLAIQKMCFSLDIVRRIVEWKDADSHPLEDEGQLGNAGIPLESNPFARGLDADDEIINRTISSSSTSTDDHHHTIISNGSCQLVILTDAESFDTTQLKCKTIKILENKWPALVRNMKKLIAEGHLVNGTSTTAENCILTFLILWENIISVKTNLSIIDILPFYSQLDTFEELLHQNNLHSCTVYKQMLGLFNEALCYGSTLALQDSSPEQLCLLAQQIVRQVNCRLLDYLPRQQPENCVGLLGFKGPNREYPSGVIEFPHVTATSELDIEMDKTILQKMFLLVLKSVAVTVKEIRSDSSDSSIDSQDTDADQEMMVIERSMRNTLRKLENFIKNTLEFHPDSHFSKILIHLLSDQDDYLIEAMVCALDVTHVFTLRNNPFPQLVDMLNPVYTFLEFLNLISNSYQTLLDFLISNETCFLLYLLRFLRYISNRSNWSMFVSSCQHFENTATNESSNHTLKRAMGVLKKLRHQIELLVSRNLFPYNISPILRLIETCESLYANDDLS